MRSILPRLPVTARLAAAGLVVSTLALSTPAHATDPCTPTSVRFSNVSVSATPNGTVTVNASALFVGVGTTVNNAQIRASINGVGTQSATVTTNFGFGSKTFTFSNVPGGNRTVTVIFTPISVGDLCWEQALWVTRSVAVPLPLTVDLDCYGGIDEPEYWCIARPDDGVGSYSYSWDLSGVDDIIESWIDGDEVDFIVGTCSPYDWVDVTVTDSAGQTATDGGPISCENEE